jgi:hypothetical protein
MEKRYGTLKKQNNIYKIKDCGESSEIMQI